MLELDGALGVNNTEQISVRNNGVEEVDIEESVGILDFFLFVLSAINDYPLSFTSSKNTAYGPESLALILFIWI